MTTTLLHLAARPAGPACAGVYDPSIRSNDRLRVRTPDGLSRVILFRETLVKERLGLQAMTDRPCLNENLESGHERHAPFPAASNARFTATRASWILYAFLLSGRAPRTAASPARIAVSSFSTCPASSCSAAVAFHGTGAT